MLLHILLSEDDLHNHAQLVYSANNLGMAPRTSYFSLLVFCYRLKRSSTTDHCDAKAFLLAAQSIASRAKIFMDTCHESSSWSSSLRFLRNYLYLRGRRRHCRHRFRRRRVSRKSYDVSAMELRSVCSRVQDIYAFDQMTK